MMKYYIGVDISKHRLDVDWCGKPVEFTNDHQGIDEFVKQLKTLSIQNQLALVLCEASGGYEQKLARACHEEKLAFHVAHANHIKYFAKSQGIKAKTDRIDAKIITAYGVERKPSADTFVLTENAEKIRELLKRREQLLLDKKREQSRLDKIETPEIKNLIEQHIEWLDKVIKEIDERLSMLQKTEEIKISHALLTSIRYWKCSCLLLHCLFARTWKTFP